ncbi:MAG: alpha/beta fold hydrolase [Alphaproteobacteria bacterium]
MPMAQDGPKSDWAEGRFERSFLPLMAETDQPEGSLSYVRAGTPGGRRVLFIHGSPGDAGIWEPQLAAVPPGRDYIAVDRPGYGYSWPHRSRPDLKDQSAALAGLLDTPDGRPVVLVGYSMGGPVALRTAVDHPDRVAGIVLASSNLDPDLEPYRWYNELASWWIFRPFIRRRWYNSNREILLHASKLEAMVPRLGEIAMPLAVIHTKDDKLVPVENTDFMRERMTAADFVHIRIVEEGGHRLPVEEPRLTTAALDAVLAALGDPPARNDRIAAPLRPANQYWPRSGARTGR